MPTGQGSAALQGGRVWADRDSSLRDEEHPREHALYFAQLVIGQSDLGCGAAKSLRGQGPHLLGDDPPATGVYANSMQPTWPLHRREGQHRHQLLTGQVQVELGGDDERGSISALFVAAYGIEVAEPHRARFDLRAVHLVNHSSVSGASAADRASASAR